MIHEANSIFYYGTRYYNPAQGRWIGRDSAGEQKGGNNFFAFCNNGPLNGIDPDGLWEINFSIGDGPAIGFEFGYNNGQFNLKFLAGIGVGSGFEYRPDQSNQPQGMMSEFSGEIGLIEGLEGALMQSEDGTEAEVGTGLKGTPIHASVGNQGLAASIVLGGIRRCNGRR